MLRKLLVLFTNHTLLCLLAIVSINAEAHAQSVTTNNSANSQPNQNQTLDNQQRNSAAVNQTGVYNIGESATYKIQGVAGIHVVCPRPSLILGSSFSSNDGFSLSNNSSYAVNAALIFPIGGSLESTCKGMAETIAKKTQYDVEIINARACAELKSAGIQLNSESFPTISVVCQGVSINRTNTNEPNKPIRFQPQESPKELPKDEADTDN
ncbi:hypothetical protein [Merismopedia glauca]|uniref:Uncharacterized protein n=1 Tax=Merismopedia glauca CCAP 1448/3 TaxID=1296344 RepID=A0A2T1C0M8_9CYAN|nr:hypothetical protein [Merismopedia glauca]PSB01728.1 hypothetical protein C7B64_16735 [Merismopedia glauca CCAP 1448/3]